MVLFDAPSRVFDAGTNAVGAFVEHLRCSHDWPGALSWRLFDSAMNMTDPAPRA